MLATVARMFGRGPTDVKLTIMLRQEIAAAWLWMKFTSRA
jgi:hypothetical protein